jgi:hypothetical protein
MTFSEHIQNMILSVTYEKTNYSNGPVKWQIVIETEPEYATDDFESPISMGVEGEKKLALETDEAEALAHALLRAVEIRRDAVSREQLRAAARAEAKAT